MFTYIQFNVNEKLRTMAQLALLIPVFNDWESLDHLLHHIDAVAGTLAHSIDVFVVDDGSFDPAAPLAPLNPAHIRSISCFRLFRNVGHQRAIAAGLAILSQRPDFDVTIIMDSDGEDRPEDIPELVRVHERHPSHIVVAQRHRRSEGHVFRLCYWFYKRLFQLFTGLGIDFGNYCLIPRQRLDSLIYDPNLWNHLAATIQRAQLPTIKVSTDRGQRYAGRSSMNFTALVLHGLSAISVFLDILVVRALIYASLIALLALVGIFVVVFLRFFTSLAIPGWATSATGILVIIIFQMIILSAGAAFTILNMRTRLLVTPAQDALKLLRSRETWHSRNPEA